jgi:hypothetical protein
MSAGSLAGLSTNQRAAAATTATVTTIDHRARFRAMPT